MLCQHFQKSAATSGTGIREHLGKEPKSLSRETDNILAKNVKPSFLFLNRDKSISDRAECLINQEVVNGGRNILLPVIGKYF